MTGIRLLRPVFVLLYELSSVFFVKTDRVFPVFRLILLK